MRSIDLIKKHFFKYIFLLTNGDMKAKINFLYFSFMLLPYYLLRNFIKIRHVNLMAPFDFLLCTPYGKFWCRGREGDFGSVDPHSYENELRSVFLQNRNFKVFIDVGAHLGKYSIMMALLNKKGKVIAIEPEPRNIKSLEKNIKINSVKNIEVLPLAAGSKNGVIRLFYDRWLDTNPSADSDFTKHLQLERYIPDKKVCISVESRKLDDILTETKSIDLIKIDVKGFELEVFKGAKNVLKKTRTIIFESFGFNRNRVLKFLKSMGFEIRPIEGDDFVGINRRFAVC